MWMPACASLSAEALLVLALMRMAKKTEEGDGPRKHSRMPRTRLGVVVLDSDLLARHIAAHERLQFRGLSVTPLVVRRGNLSALRERCGRP